MKRHGATQEAQPAGAAAAEPWAVPAPQMTVPQIPAPQVPAPKTSAPPATPQVDTPEELGFERQPMVDWLSPVQLARTGLQVYLSSAFGSFFDKREIQAVAGVAPAVERDYSADGEIWFDYVADLGDGFNSTYTVARLLGAAALAPGPGALLPRGRFLVMGGDQVYPTASREEYLNRFEGPYRAALPWVEDDLKAPHLYAIPGNHDWYDGLTSFTRLFCQFGAQPGTYRWVGGWRTRQTRSYFALKLPAGWWLWGIDVQLSSYIDKPQISYFEAIARQMREEDPEPRLILVTPQPGWVGCAVGEPGSRSVRDPGQFDSLEYFESRVIRKHGIRPALVVAGDLHHYCRYQQAPGAAGAAGAAGSTGAAGSNNQPPTQRVTSGGGGGYLYATHQMPASIEVPEGAGAGDPKTTPRVTYRRTVAYPAPETSRKLARGVWRLPGKSWTFSLLVGAIYLLFGWTLDLTGGLNPLSLFFALALILGFWGLARVQGRAYRPRLPWLGLAHGVAHVLLGVGLFAGFKALNRGIPPPFAAIVLSVEMLAGGFLGALLFAAYLAAASRLCSAHTEEVFSCQAIADYKSFLRLHIARDGTLTVRALGIDRVPRRWRLNRDAPPGQPWFEPEAGEPPLAARVVDAFEIPASGARRPG